MTTATTTKVLTATTRGQGARKNDFCHATDGELVGFTFECDRERVDGRCGCRRSMSGMTSHKATTTVVVTERHGFTADDLRDAVEAALRSGGWITSEVLSAEDAAWVQQDADDLMKIATAFPVGTVLEKRGNSYRTRRVS